jgi:hypothetical protein
MGYDACGGKLTLCGYDQFNTAKYCYSTYRAAATPTLGQPKIPFGWFSYSATASMTGPVSEPGSNKEVVKTIRVDSTLRYDISSELYNSRNAVHSKVDQQSTSSLGSIHMVADEYLDPVSYAIIGGTATMTANGKTISINLADMAKIMQSNSGMTYSQPSQLSSGDLGDMLRYVASQSGAHLYQTTESVTVPAGTFSSATKYSLSMSGSEGGTMTMNMWTDPSVPVLLKMQASDSAGTTSATMELTGYQFTGSSSSSNPLASLFSGGGVGTSVNPSGGAVQQNVQDLENTAMDALQKDLNGVGMGSIDIKKVPAAVSDSVTPATFGAVGALAGGTLGALSLFFPTGLPESDTEGEGGSGGAVDDILQTIKGKTIPESETPASERPMSRLEQLAAEAGREGPVEQLGAPPLDINTLDADDPVGNAIRKYIAEQENSDISADKLDKDDPVWDVIRKYLAENENSDMPMADRINAIITKYLHDQENINQNQFAQQIVNNDPALDRGNIKLTPENLDSLITVASDTIQKMHGDKWVVINPWLVDTSAPHFAGEISLSGISSYVNWKEPPADVVYVQCGECAYGGRNRSQIAIGNVFGEGTYVDVIAIRPDSRDNHSATFFITPSGDRYVVDYWESYQRTYQDPINNPDKKTITVIKTEEEWVNFWKTKLDDPNSPVTHSEAMNDFQKLLMEKGEQRGIEEFVKQSLANGSPSLKQTATIVNSYRKHPWFTPAK